MIRAFALLFAALIMLAGGPNFFGGGGSSPIRRTVVSFTGNYAPGTIYISTAERRLYLVLGNGQALRYGIGVGRDGFRWSGVHRITAKKEWPSWTPPAQMLRRRPDLPRHMVGGIDNPLGARAMYLGSTLYRIHGSNEPETIGQAVSSGCFRMTNEDVTDLYDRVRVGTPVIVRN
jgi:lipoprotein-anchoring transpeptidase ErfK/SrfK